MSGIPAKPRLRSYGALALAFALPILTTGCSKDMDDLGYTPATLGVEDARKKTLGVSSAIFDMIAIKEGRTTETGAGVSPCEEDPDHLFSSRHPWGLYGVSAEELEEGFARLRESLPKHGWKIVDYGPNSSANKNLELTADSTKDHYAVNAELRVTGDPGSKKPSIQVRVVSGCFRAPEGTDLNGIY
ncbi:MULTISPECIES: hypothetical protein [unclassified Streptomyces]|uniref:hypothetical protein n=1 Tax=unclassified Streptomyces TaxID=2593676 RepID=UPI0033BAEA9E